MSYETSSSQDEDTPSSRQKTRCGSGGDGDGKKRRGNKRRFDNDNDEKVRACTTVLPCPGNEGILISSLASRQTYPVIIHNVLFLPTFQLSPLHAWSRACTFNSWHRVKRRFDHGARLVIVARVTALPRVAEVWAGEEDPGASPS